MRVNRPAFLMSLVAVVLLVFLPTGGTASVSFPDVPATHEFYEPISSLAEMSIVSGYTDGNFGLYDPVRRAQVAKMSVIAYGHHTELIENQTSPRFTDVTYTGTAYPFDFVQEAYAAGIIQGYASGTFGPYDNLTRIQLVRILVRAAGEDLAAPPADYSTGFGDVAAEDALYVAKAKFNGLVDGKSATSFAPYEGATRGHVAKILYNALKKHNMMEPRTRQEVMLTPAATAAALAEPATAEAGVWSLLANLGIGVYVDVGQPVMPGSERSEDDFYLFAVEIPALVGAATESGPTTTELHEQLSALGLNVTESALLADLRTIYLERNDGEFLPELFREMGTSFGPGEQLTSLQAILLYIDLLLPPNGGPFAVQEDSEPANPAWGWGQNAADTLTTTAFEDLMDEIGEKAAQKAVGKVLTYADWANSALHAVILFAGTELDIDQDVGRVHEKHPDGTTDPNTAAFTVTARFNPGNVPKVLRAYFELATGEALPDSGPISGLGVEWGVDETMAEHGYIRYEGENESFRQITDSAGQSKIYYDTKDEPAQGVGTINTETGHLTATVRVQGANLMNFFAGIQELLLPRRAPGQLMIQWHEQPWNLELKWRDLNEEGDLAFNWSFDLVVNEDGTISGSGTGSVYGYSLLYPDDRRIKATTSADFEYRIDSTKARQETLGAGSEENHWLVFSPGAFIPTAQSARLFDPGVTPEDEQLWAEITVDAINLLIEDIASLGELRVPMVDGASSYALVPGANEDQLYYTLTVGLGVPR